MEKQSVIRKVSEHTDWCSSLAYSEKRWITPRMHRLLETQSSPEAMSTQSSHTWRAESSVCRVNSLQQVGCQSWLLVSPSWPRQPVDHYISDPVWSILLDEITIWTQGVTRPIPSQNGRDLGRPSRRGRDHRWRLRAWQRWRGARPEPESAYEQSKRNRAGVQFRQVHNQTTWDQLLRQHLLQRWHQTWPGLRSLVKRPLEPVPVGWSEPLHVIMNIPVEQDYDIEHGKATNQQVND